MSMLGNVNYAVNDMQVQMSKLGDVLQDVQQVVNNHMQSFTSHLREFRDLNARSDIEVLKLRLAQVQVYLMFLSVYAT